MSTEENVNIEAPVTYEDLKKSANRSANWRERVQAVKELGKDEWNSEQTIHLLTRIMQNDSVRRVQEAAYDSLRGLGEPAQMPAKKQEELVKGLTKTLVRIKKSLPEGHSYEEFKEKLKKMRIDIYDTYEGDKGNYFDTWLEEKWASLRTKKY
ncbi:hypothetical protein D3C81_1055590 [compost metagenome]